MQKTVRKLLDENENLKKNMESVNYTNLTFQENKELKGVNDLLKMNMDQLNKQMVELCEDQEKNEQMFIQKVLKKQKKKSNKLIEISFEKDTKTE